MLKNCGGFLPKRYNSKNLKKKKEKKMHKFKTITLLTLITSLLGFAKVNLANENKVPMFYQRMNEIGQVLASYEVARLMCETIETYPNMKYSDQIRLVVSKLDNEMTQLFMETENDFVQTLISEYISEHCAEAYKNNLNR